MSLAVSAIESIVFGQGVMQRHERRYRLFAVQRVGKFSHKFCGRAPELALRAAQVVRSHMATLGRTTLLFDGGRFNFALARTTALGAI